MKKLLIFSVMLFSVIVCVTSVHAGWLDSLFGSEESQQKQPQDQLPDKWVLKEINLEMVKCPAGSFMMGSPKEELGRDDVERLHSVTITKPFYIGKYEVTQSQYVALMEKNPSEFVGANNPVERVSYNDAKAFCDKLNLKYLNQLPQGYKFDLPTEAQWEYACRAGTTTALNNGKNLTKVDGACFNLDEVAWYCEYSNKTTHEVGLKKSNAWGIYDMHGNLWEWCKDMYAGYPTDAVTDPICITGSNPVVRGGSWFNFPYRCRSAHRYHLDPSFMFNDLGFRVSLVPIN